MTEPLSKRRLRLWIRLLLVTRLAEKELSEFVRTEHGTTLPRFDVLAALYRADEPMTMGELSRQLLVSNGNTTTVVARLHADGLVDRSPAETDRRVVMVALTPAGRAHFEQLATDHERRVDQLFGDASAADLDQLDELLHRLTPRKAR
ncbi:MAG: MarR family winged helix-turn-helix transcriptional regulator [Ilumatobacteraceae bacterium]